MKRLLFLLVVLGTLACQEQATTDPAEVRAIIESHNADLVRWYAEGQIDSAAMVFAEAAWQMPPNAPPLVGREAYHTFWSQAATWGEWNFTLDAQDVVTHGPIAVERGKYTLRFTPNDQAPEEMGAMEDAGNYVVLWRQDPDGEWRVVWDAPVSEKPLPGPGSP